MYSCLLDEVSCLVEAYSVAFRIADCFADGEIVSLSSVAVFSRTFEAVDGFLFELRYCNAVSCIDRKCETLTTGDLHVAI